MATASRRLFSPDDRSDRVFVFDQCELHARVAGERDFISFRRISQVRNKVEDTRQFKKEGPENPGLVKKL